MITVHKINLADQISTVGWANQSDILPLGAVIRTVAVQRGDPVMYVELDTEETRKQSQKVVCMGTGHEKPPGNWFYLGTTFLYGGDLVLHWYEDTP